MASHTQSLDATLTARVETTNEMIDLHRSTTDGALDAVTALSTHFRMPVTIEKLHHVSSIARQFYDETTSEVVSLSGRTVVADVRVGNGGLRREAALTAFNILGGDSGLEVVLPSACGTKNPKVYQSIDGAPLARVIPAAEPTDTPHPDAHESNDPQRQQQTKITWPGRDEPA